MKVGKKQIMRCAQIAALAITAAGFSWMAYRMLSPHLEPSPSSCSKRGVSCGVEMTRMSRIPERTFVIRSMSRWTRWMFASSLPWSIWTWGVGRSDNSIG